jgi:hypothetical protein
LQCAIARNTAESWKNRQFAHASILLVRPQAGAQVVLPANETPMLLAEVKNRTISVGAGLGSNNTTVEKAKQEF